MKQQQQKNTLKQQDQHYKAQKNRTLPSPQLRLNHPVLQMQGILGNHGVLLHFGRGIIQPKLKIGEPNDRYEQEADRVAEQLMRMTKPIVQYEDFTKKEKKEVEEEVQEEKLIQTKKSYGQSPWIQRQTKTPPMKKKIAPVPQWEQLPSLAKTELARKGYNKSWFDARSNDNLIRLTVLNLYVKLRGIQGQNFWNFVGREIDSKTGALQFTASNVRDLKSTLKARDDFTSPEDSIEKWSSREMRASGSLHFKHFLGWPEEKVQAHIDQTGLLLRSKAWWLMPVIPLIQMGRHGVEYLGYDDFTDVFGVRDILLGQGWWTEPLLGVSVTMQRKALPERGTLDYPFLNIEILKGQGQSLPMSTRTFFESRFGYDFSNVRIHTNTNAAESANKVNALAYTVGQNIVFGTGHYAPETSTGQKLIAHELTHVIQQTLSTKGTIPDVQCQEVTKTKSASRDVINIEETLSIIEGWQLGVAGWAAERNIIAKIGAFIPFFLLELLRRIVQLGNLLFGVTELQNATDVIFNPAKTLWERIKAGIWAAIIVVLDFMMVGGIAEKISLKLSSMITKLGQTSFIQGLKTVTLKLLDEAVKLARNYFPKFLVFLETKSSMILDLAKRGTQWILNKVTTSSVWQKLTEWSSRKITLPKFIEALDSDIIGWVRKRLGSEASDLVSKKGGISTVIGEDIERLKQARELEQATIISKEEKELAGEIGTELIMRLKGGWRTVELPRLPGNQGVDLLFTRDGLFVSSKNFATAEAKGGISKAVSGRLKNYTFNGQSYRQGDPLFNRLRLSDPRLIQQVPAAEQPALQNLVNQIVDNIDKLKAYYGRVQTATKDIRLFRLDLGTYPNYPEIIRMTFGEVKTAFYVVVLGETAPQAIKFLPTKE